MFTFLNTTILTGLAAITIPLLIHLLTRQKVKKVYYSSLMFLKELKTQQIRRIKIRQILLMIIRSLIILFLILTFARPTMKGSFTSNIELKAKTSAVIIFDNSMSMARISEGSLALDEAKGKVKELRSLFKDGDQIYSIYVSPGIPEIYANARYDFKHVQKSILDTDVSYHSTDILSALLRARELLISSTNVNKEIYIISDMQQSGFSKLENLQSSVLSGTGIKVFVAPCNTDKINNLGILKLEFVNQIIEKGKVIELEVIVKNYGHYDVRNKLVQLFLENKRLAQATINIKQGESQKVTFRIVPDKSGILTGTVLLEDDDLLLDNRFYFNFYVPDRIHTLIIGEREKDITLLKYALEVSPNIIVNTITYSKLKLGDFKNYDVVVLSNVPQLNNSFANEFIRYIEQGGGCILFLGNDLDLKAYNTNLNKKLALPQFQETIGTLGNQGSFLSFGKIDYSHPVFKGMFDNAKGQIESPRLYFSVKITQNRETETIIELTNRIPFLSETDFKKGKILLFNTAIDIEWSDFYLKGIFAPLINRSVLYLAGVADKTEKNLFVDQEIYGVLKNNIEFTDIVIEKPDGSTSRIKPEISGGNVKITYHDTNLVGVYSLKSGEKLLDLWTLNVDPAESDLKVIPKDEFERIVGKNHVWFIEKRNTLLNEVIDSRYGRELWKYSIIIVLMLVVAEMFMSKEYKLKEKIN